jgi:hypothetical protein
LTHPTSTAASWARPAPYFTTGKKESRAWTLYEGSTAPVCAGRIHTNFPRGFIKAEVIQLNELVELDSRNKAKEVATLRVEGKDCIAHVGGVREVRFRRVATGRGRQPTLLRARRSSKSFPST